MREGGRHGKSREVSREEVRGRVAKYWSPPEGGSISVRLSSLPPLPHARYPLFHSQQPQYRTKTVLEWCVTNELLLTRVAQNSGAASVGDSRLRFGPANRLGTAGTPRLVFASLHLHHPSRTLFLLPFLRPWVSSTFCAGITSSLRCHKSLGTRFV